MNFLTRLLAAKPKPAPGIEDRAGDHYAEDEWLDTEALMTPVMQGLVGTSGMVQSGRIRWDLILKDIVPESKITWCDGWQTKGAPVMDPVASLWHWTAGRPSAKNTHGSLSICVNGRPDVPGPMVHGLIGWEGHLWIIASGRANHAGKGHQPLIARMRSGKPPKGTARGLGLTNTGGSGGSLAGWEIEASGTEPFTPAQCETVGQIAAATTLRLGWTEAQAIQWSHMHWTNRKIDIDAKNMERMLNAYRKTLSQHSNKPAPVVTDELVMATPGTDPVKVELTRKLAELKNAGITSEWRTNKIREIEAQIAEL